MHTFMRWLIRFIFILSVPMIVWHSVATGLEGAENTGLINALLVASGAMLLLWGLSGLWAKTLLDKEKDEALLTRFGLWNAAMGWAFTTGMRLTATWGAEGDSSAFLEIVATLTKHISSAMLLGCGLMTAHATERLWAGLNSSTTDQLTG